MSPAGRAFARLSRRAALRRAAALAGLAAAPAWLGRALAAAPGPAARLGGTRDAVLAAAAERILPRTETPGAADVGVPAFIARLLADFLPAEERALFLPGLDLLEARARASHGRGFAELSPEPQDALLRALAAESEANPRTFFHQLREFTLLGYFTSERVGREVLHHDPVPGRWDPCVPLAEVGDRSWTR